jgi:hypothetical protein
VKEMSVWELSAALDGWSEAHTPKKPGAISAAEEDLLWADVQNWRMQ